MGLLKKLFGSRKVTLRDLQLALRSTERDRERKLAALETLEARRGDLFVRIKTARSKGRTTEVDVLWEDLRQVKVECGLERRETRILNLEVIALKRTTHAMERLEASKDSHGVRELLRKVRASGLDDKLMAQEIQDEEYLRELDDILQEAEAQLDLSSTPDEDPAKAAFLAEIDAINAAEAVGDVDGARTREAELKDRFAAEENG